MKDKNEPGAQGQGVPTNQEGRHERHGQNRSHACQRWNNNTTSGGKFRGKRKEIKNDTLNNTGPHNAVLFNKSLKNIAGYLQREHGNDVSDAARNMTLVTIIIP